MLLPELKDGARLHHVGCYLPREPEHTCGELSQEGLACGCSRGTQGCRQRDLPGSLWNGGGALPRVTIQFIVQIRTHLSQRGCC